MNYAINPRGMRLAVLNGLVGLSLVACGGDEAPVASEGGSASAGASYELTLQNLTAGQPLSPAVAIVHNEGYQLFEVGQAAGVGLERLAEGAQTDSLLAEINDLSTVKASATSNGGPVGPGNATRFTIEAGDADPAAERLRLSLVTMLVNSNDAIAAVNGDLNLAMLEVGQQSVTDLISYDTGTEANRETAATMPGPAGGGEGFNPARDDIRDAVHVHQGPVTSDDGLSASALSSIHRWQHPVARLTVRRLN